MRVRQHKGDAKRLISAVAALALVIAQVIGAYAHAGEHGHGGAHAACVHQLGHGSAVPAAGDDGGVDKAEHDGDRAHYDTSCDFCCHGGIAILATVAIAYVNPMLPYSRAVAVAEHPAAPPSLERPPRSSARA
jgi:hypothetical protein